MKSLKFLLGAGAFLLIVVSKLSAQGTDFTAPLGTSYKDYRTEGVVPIDPVSPGLPPINIQPVGTGPAAAVVPEPRSSLLILAAGAGAVALRSYRRKRSS